MTFVILVFRVGWKAVANSVTRRLVLDNLKHKGGIYDNNLNI